MSVDIERQFTDEELAGFATPRWVENVAAVPLNEAAAMITEDPSVLTALVGAVRHARARVAELERERDEYFQVAETQRQLLARFDDAVTARADARTMELRAQLAAMESERDAYRAGLCDLLAASGCAAGVNSSLDYYRGKTRDLLKNGPSAPDATNAD